MNINLIKSITRTINNKNKYIKKQLQLPFIIYLFKFIILNILLLTHVTKLVVKHLPQLSTSYMYLVLKIFKYDINIWLPIKNCF